MPDMFVNSNRYSLGVTDQGQSVADVELPKWAKTPEEFVRVNRLVKLQTKYPEFNSSMLLHSMVVLFRPWSLRSCPANYTSGSISSSATSNAGRKQCAPPTFSTT